MGKAVAQRITLSGEQRLAQEIRKIDARVKLDIQIYDEVYSLIGVEERYMLAIERDWTTSVICFALPLSRKLISNLRSKVNHFISDSGDAAGQICEMYINWLRKKNTALHQYVFQDGIKISTFFNRLRLSFIAHMKYKIFDMIDTEHLFYTSDGGFSEGEKKSRDWRTVKADRSSLFKYLVLSEEAKKCRPLNQKERNEKEAEALKQKHKQITSIFLNGSSNHNSEPSGDVDLTIQKELSILSEGSLAEGASHNSSRLHWEIETLFATLRLPDTLLQLGLDEKILDAVLFWYDENLTHLAYGEALGDGNRVPRRPTQASMAKQLNISPDQFFRACQKVPKAIKKLTENNDLSEVRELIGWFEHCSLRN